MPRYCIVVKSANEGLFRALEEAFLGRSEFSVVRERRMQPSAAPGMEERRKSRVWETGELLFAEYRGE
jgi:hypothetical protein